MKTITLAVLTAGIVTFTLAGTSHALFIGDGTDVGLYDTLIAEASQSDINKYNGGDDGKTLSWINYLRDPDTLFAYKDDELSHDVDFQKIFLNNDTPVSGGYAFELTANSPDYFLIKTGNVTDDGHRYFLFENNINDQWAVFNLASMGFNSITNITGISHIEVYGAHPVPEPATMLLVGTGVIGFLAARRKKNP